MWPFKKQVPKVDLEKEALRKRLKSVEVFAPLGSFIEYLGVKMMVVGHNDFIPLIYAEPIYIPCLKLERMDSMQRLQRASLRDNHFCLCKVISTPENKESAATVA
jgi:hypothetical protein